jgi:hypothetical protein
MFDLATAKTRLGLTDTLSDALVAAAIAASMSFAEKYCDRKFSLASETAHFYHITNKSVQFDRYPITAIISTTPATLNYSVHKSAGILEFDSAEVMDELIVSYTGGFAILPPDLEMAMWAIFDNVWPSFSGGGTATVAAGTIQSITLQDVGTVRYASGSGASGASNAAGGLIPESAMFILGFYRKFKC